MKLVLLALGLGCACKDRPSTAPLPDAGGSPADAGGSPADGGGTPADGADDPRAADTAPVGVWTSAACGERTYPRELTLAEGGAINGRDLVSPCPAGATCVWSGIATWSGTWSRNGDRVMLELEAPKGGPVGQDQLPAFLWWRDEGLVEPDDCGYTRAG